MEAINERIASTSELTQAEKALIIPCGYGHMSEGDIQISIGVINENGKGRELRDKVSHVVDQHLVDFVSAKGGSITGEHGIGLQRANQFAS